MKEKQRQVVKRDFRFHLNSRFSLWKITALLGENRNGNRILDPSQLSHSERLKNNKEKSWRRFSLLKSCGERRMKILLERNQEINGEIIAIARFEREFNKSFQLLVISMNAIKKAFDCALSSASWTFSIVKSPSISIAADGLNWNQYSWLDEMLRTTEKCPLTCFSHPM